MTIEQYPSSNNIATTTVWKYTATGSELTLSGYDNYSQALQFTAGSEQVYLNGVLLVRNLDYTPAANGLSITFPTNLAYNDFVQIYCYSNYSIASVASSSITGTIQNAQLSNSSITIGNQSISLGNAITTLTGTSISGSTNTLTNIPNSALSNSSIIINGNPISLGGTVNITTPNTILSQKGGIIVGTGGGSVTQLTVGADGTTPIADSTQATNISWAGPINISGKNYLFNGNMESDQRNNGAVVTATTSAPAYLVDRWYLNYVQVANITAQRVAGTNTGTQYAQRITGATGNANLNWAQRIDAINAYSLAGKTVTISMKLYASTAISTAKFFVILPSSYDNYTSPTVPVFTSININSGLNSISYTFTMPSGATNGAEVGINFTAGLGNNVYVDISNVQLEIGSVATTFARSGGSYNGDIALSGSAGFDGVLVSTNSSISPTSSGTPGWAGYYVSGKNFLINGLQEIDQRNAGAAVTVNSALKIGLDRWFLFNSAATNATVQRVAGTNTGTQYAARITGSFSGNYAQRIESYQIAPATGQIVTFSGKIYGSTSGITVSTYAIYAGTQDNYATNTSISTAASTISVSTTPTKFSVTFVIPSAATNGVEVGINTTLGSGVYIDVSSLQLELGTVASQISRSGGNYPQEKLACMRYFQSSFPEGVAPQQNYSPGIIQVQTANAALSGGFLFPVPMKKAPNMTFYNPYAANSSGRYANSSTDVAIISYPTWNTGVNYITWGTTTTTSQAIHLNWSADAEIY